MLSLKTLTPCEQQVFPITPEELDGIISLECFRTASVLRRYEKKKKKLKSQNKGPIHEWPTGARNQFLALQGRIAAETEEIRDFINRLTTEVYQEII